MVERAYCGLNRRWTIFPGDGLVDEDEYVFGTYKVQKVIQTAGSDDQALIRRK